MTLTEAAEITAMEIKGDEFMATTMPDDYPVKCDCGFRGWRFDCSRGECPNCGDRVQRDNGRE